MKRLASINFFFPQMFLDCMVRLFQHCHFFLLNMWGIFKECFCPKELALPNFVKATFVFEKHFTEFVANAIMVAMHVSVYVIINIIEKIHQGMKKFANEW